MFLQFGHENVTEGHGSRADLGPNHLKAPADLARRAGHALVIQMRCKIAVFSQSRDYGHEVRFTGAIVTHNHQPLVVHGLVELKLRNNQIDQLFGHLIGDDIGLDKPPSGSGLVGLP